MRVIRREASMRLAMSVSGARSSLRNDATWHVQQYRDECLGMRVIVETESQLHHVSVTPTQLIAQLCLMCAAEINTESNVKV